MRPRPALIRLLTVLLLLQWGTAFGHCLRLAAPAAAAGLEVEICTAEGLHRVVLPLGAEEGDGGNGGPHEGHAPVLPCPACAGPAAVALPAPAVVIAPPPVLLVQRADPPPPAPPPSPEPSPSCRPRAPPTS